MQKYQNLVYTVCYGILQDHFAAGDLTQETFIKVYTALDSYNGKSFKSWIARIATNTSIDYLRAKKRKSGKNSEYDVLEYAIPADEDLEEEYLKRERDRELMEVLEALPEIYRETVMKYYFENKSYAAIAEECGVSVKTEESRLYRAKNMLKKRLEGAR